MPERSKRQETEVAHRLGIPARNPTDGSRHPDVDAGPFAIEVKTRRALPKLVTDSMAQCCRAARPGQTPIVVLTEVSQGRQAARYVVMRFEDFQDWFGKLPEEWRT